jgi:hypothetical protein
LREDLGQDSLCAFIAFSNEGDRFVEACQGIGYPIVEKTEGWGFECCATWVMLLEWYLLDDGSTLINHPIQVVVDMG